MKLINQIINGDCQEVLKQLPDNSIDFILTDPPYLVNYKSRDGRSIRNDRNGNWLLPVNRELYRVLKSNRFMASFYGWQAADLFLSSWKGAGFYPVGHLVFTKPYASSEKFVRYQHEQAYLLAKNNPHLPDEPIPDVLPWRYSGNGLHPTQKPVEALLPLIDAYTLPGDLVLDPFCGSGTTCVAARKLGCRYIGIELDEGYAKAAQRRLAGERGGRP